MKHSNAPSPAERVDSTSPAKKVARILFVWTAAIMMPLGASEAGGRMAASGRLEADGEIAGWQSENNAGVVKKLIAKSEHGPVPVIVRFTIERASGQRHRAEATLTASEATVQRQAIQQVRDGVLARLERADYRNVKTYPTLPLVAFEAGPAALRQIAGAAEVVWIEEDVAEPPYLAESIPLIGADIPLSGGYGGAGWVVAILDTGIDSKHRFLVGKMVSEACYSSNLEGSASLCPRQASESTAEKAGRNCSRGIFGCDHGTHVAGIAAGKGDTFHGVAPDAGLISIQVFSRFSGTSCTDYFIPSPCVLSFVSDQIRGLERVLELSRTFNIASVNLSLGGRVFANYCDRDPRKLAIDSLRVAGIATVISSGNAGLDGMISRPACISSAVAVGSTTKIDRVSSFSDYARTIDLMAPGSRINSSVPGNRFAVFSGTSMAAPHVAGAFALLRSVVPKADVDQIEAALEMTGRNVQRAGITLPRIQVDAAADELLIALSRPSNDDFRSATVLVEDSGSERAANVAATRQQGEPRHAGARGGSSVWWRWRAPRDGRATVSTLGSDFDTTLAVYTGQGLRRLTETASNDDRAGLSQSEIEFIVSADTVYFIAIDGAGGAEGKIVLNYAISGIDGGSDRFRDAVTLETSASVTTGSNVGATAQPREPRHAGVGGGKSLWWRWRAPADGKTIVTTLGSDFDTVLSVYRGRSLRRITEIASNDDGPNMGSQSLVQFEAKAGLTYRIVVDGADGAEGYVTLTLAGSASPASALLASHRGASDAAERVASAVEKYVRHH